MVTLTTHLVACIRCVMSSLSLRAYVVLEKFFVRMHASFECMHASFVRMHASFEKDFPNTDISVARSSDAVQKYFSMYVLIL